VQTIAPLTVEHHGPKVHQADAAFINISTAFAAATETPIVQLVYKNSGMCGSVGSG